MFQSREGKDHACGKCIKMPSTFGKARAYGLYDGALRKSIHCLKYHQQAYLAEPLGLLLFSAFIKHWDPNSVHIIVPIPLHASRLKKRGFNQAFQLIRKWPEWSVKAATDDITVNIDQNILRRRKKTKAQVGMGKKERIKNIKGVFEVIEPSRIEGKNVLLVDDVLTTGATANECVRLLVKNGARNVDVLTLAHTERHVI
ncbi:MAG: ComF family protein [Desulfobacterales bacterium]